MKKFIATMILGFTLSAAAPKLGQSGTVTVQTVVIDAQQLGAMGMPVVPGVATITELFFKSTDPTVTAFRVVITYSDSAGDHVVSQLCDVPTNGSLAGTYLTNVQPDQVKSIVVTSLRAAGPAELVG
jgi:hypothetical protein